MTELKSKLCPIRNWSWNLEECHALHMNMWEGLHLPSLGLAEEFNFLDLLSQELVVRKLGEPQFCDAWKRAQAGNCVCQIDWGEDPGARRPKLCGWAHTWYVCRRPQVQILVSSGGSETLESYCLSSGNTNKHDSPMYTWQTWYKTEHCDFFLKKDFSHYNVESQWNRSVPTHVAKQFLNQYG